MSGMTPERWRRFRGSLIIGVIVAGYFLFENGVLESLQLGGILILSATIAAIGVVLYLFWKKLPDDSRWVD